MLAKSVSVHLHVGADPEHCCLSVTTEYAWQDSWAVTPRHHAGTGYRQQGSVAGGQNAFHLSPDRDGTNSGSTVMINFAQRKVLIAGMRYAGEMKKSMFSVLNFLLPEKDVLPCTALQMPAPTKT